MARVNRSRNICARLRESKIETILRAFTSTQTDTGELRVCFTLSAATLELRDLPEEIQRGRPRFPLPATLLGRFGVDREFENRGLGSLLLGLALVNAYTASKLVASAAVVLTIASDASERASALYRKYGFLPLPSDTNRMILMMSVVRKNLDREDRRE